MAMKKVPMYIKNVATSIKYSGQDFVKQQMPSTMDFVETNTDVLRSVTTDLRNYKNIYRQAKQWWSASSVATSINEAKKNAISDLKTGKFYNKARADKEAFAASGWEDVLGGFEDEINSAMNDYNSGNDDVVDAQISTNKAINTQTEATVGILSAVGTTLSNTTIDSAEYIVKNQNSIASQTMVNDHKMFMTVSNILTEMGDNVRGIYQYTGEMSKYFNDTKTKNEALENKLEQLIALTRETTEMKRNEYQEYFKSKDTAYHRNDSENFLGSSFNIKEYMNTVKGRIKKEIENSGMASMGGGMMGEDFNPLQLLAANPLSFISNAAFNKMVSKELRTSMQTLDKTMSGFFKSSMLKLSSNLRQKGSDNAGFDLLNRIFGINTNEPGNMRSDTYVKSPVPWNGIAERALTEVIPTYLRKMLSAMTGQDEMIYNYESGKFNKISEVKKSYENDLDSSYNDMNGMKEQITKLINTFTFSNEMQKQMDADIKDLFKFIVDKGVFYNPETMSNDFLKDNGLYLKGGNESFDLINSAFKSLDRSKWNQMNGDVLNAISRRHNDIADLNKNGQKKGYTALINGFENQINENGKSNVSGGMLIKDEYGKNVHGYLRDIREILLDGIRVYTTEYDHDAFDTLSGTSDNRMKRYQENMIALDNITAHNEYNKSQEELAKEAKEKYGKVVQTLSDINLSPIGQQEYFTRMANGGILESPQTENKANPIVEKASGAVSKIFDAGKEIASVPEKVLKGILDSVNDNLLFFLYGGQKDGKKSLIDKMIDRVNNFGEKIVNSVELKVINPINNFLFNDDTGVMTKLNNKIRNITEKISDKLFNENNGVFTGIRKSFSELMDGTDDKPGLKQNFKNGISDISNGFMNVLVGREYVSKVSGKKVEAREETMFSIMKNAFTSVSDYSKELFHKHFKESTLKETLSNSINKHTASASRVLFGTSDYSMSPKEFFSRNISHRLPKASLGVIGGLGLSLFTPLGLIGGTMLGGATGFLSTTKGFKDVLFGEQGSDRRQSVDKIFNNINAALPRMGVGSIAGIGLSMISPLGLLGGMMIGGASGYLSTSDKFKEMIFGNGTDKKAIIDKKYYEAFKEKLPGGALGAGVGILGSMFLPGGPVGGALMGLTLGIAGQSNMIKTYLFGDVNPETDKRSGGLFGKMKLYMQAEILMPLKTFAKQVGSKGLYFLRKELVNPVLDAIAPIRKEISLIKDRIIDSVKNIKDRIVDKFTDMVIKPFGDTMNKYILDPIKKQFKNLFGGIFNAMKGIITAPSKLINALGMNLMKKHERDGVADYKEEWQKKKNARDTKTEDDYRQSQFNIKGEKWKNDMVSKLMRKGGYDENNPATKKAMAYMNIEVSNSVKSMDTNMKESTTILDRISNLFSEFKTRWETRNSFNEDDSKKYKEPKSSKDKKENNSTESDTKVPKFDNVVDFNSFKKDKTSKDKTGNKKEYNSVPKANNVTDFSSFKKDKSNNNASQSEPKYDNISNFKVIKGGKSNNDSVSNSNVETDYNTGKYATTSKKPNHDTDNTKSPEYSNKIRSIDSNVGIIKDSVQDQLNGTGYHLEMISNILIDQFGMPSVLPGAGGIKGFASKIGSMFRKPKNIINGIFDIIMKPFNMVTNAVSAIPKAIFGAGKQAVSIFSSVFNKVGNIALQTIVSIGKTVPKILDIVNTVLGGVVDVTVSAFKALPAVVSTLGSVIKDTSKVFGALALDLTKSFGTALKYATKSVGELTLGFAKLAKEAIPEIFKLTAGIAKFVGVGAFKGVKGAFGLAGSLLGIGGKNNNNSFIETVNIKTVEKVNEVDYINKIGTLERISDARLYESLGNIVTAVHGIKTGTDDMPLSTDIARKTGNDSKDKKDSEIKNKVIDINDRLKKAANKKKNQENSVTVDGSNLPKVTDISKGNTQVDAFKNKEIGQRNAKRIAIKENLSIIADKANITTGKIIGRVFKKGGTLSLIGDLLLLGLPKLFGFFKNIKTRSTGFVTDLKGKLFNKFGLDGFNLPKVTDLKGKLPKKFGIDGFKLPKVTDLKGKLLNKFGLDGSNLPKATDISKGNAQVDAFKNKKSEQRNAKRIAIKEKLSVMADKANITTGKIMSKVFKKGGVLSIIGDLLLIGLPKLFGFIKNIKMRAMSFATDLIGKLLKKLGIGKPLNELGTKAAGEVAEYSAKRIVLNNTEKVAEKAATKGVLEASAKKLGKDTMFNGAKRLGKDTMINGTEHLGQKLLTDGGKISIHDAIEEGMTKYNKKGFVNTIKTTGSNIIEKIMNSKPVQKLAGSKIASHLAPLAKALSSRMASAGKGVFAKIAAKWSAIIGSGVASGGVIPIIWYGGSILMGIAATNRMFGLPKGYKPTVMMRTIAGFSSFVSELVTWGFVPPDYIAQFLANRILTDKDTEVMQVGQQLLHQKYEDYMEKTGETIDLDEYNSKIENRSMVSKAWGGIKSGANAVIDGAKYVAKPVWNGIKAVGNTVWDGAKYGAGKVKDFAMNNTALAAFNDDKIRESLGLDPDTEITFQDRIAMGTGTVLSNMTFGLINKSNMTKIVNGGIEVFKDAWVTVKDAVVNTVMNKTALSAFNDDRIREVLHIDNDTPITFQDRISLGAGSAISNMTFGLIKQKDSSNFISDGLDMLGNAWTTVKNTIVDTVMNKTVLSAFNDDRIREVLHIDKDTPITFQDRISLGAGSAISNMTFGLIKQKDTSNFISSALDKFSQVWISIGNFFSDLIKKIPEKLNEFDKKLGDMLGLEDEKGESTSLTTWTGMKYNGAKNWVINAKNTVSDFVSSPFRRLIDKSDQAVARRNQGGNGMDGVEKNAGAEYGNTTMNNAVYYSQNEEPWASKDYGYGKSISQAGCGPTSAAMLLSSVTGNMVTPEDAASYALSRGHRVQGNGTGWGFFKDIGSKYGVGFNQTGSFDSVENALEKGQPVILSGKGAPPFTKGGHYVMAVGKTSDGKIIVNDPVSRDRSKAYDRGLIRSETAQAWISDKGLGNVSSMDLGSVTNSKSSTTPTTSSKKNSGKIGVDEALSKLKEIVSSYTSTVVSGGVWDESMLESESTTESPENTISSTSAAASNISSISKGNSKISDRVLSLAPTVHKYAEAAGIGDKTPLLLAQIMQEAGGSPKELATDPMQSAESKGLAPGSLKDPETSIKWGIEAFKTTLDKSGGDVKLALQSYNFGPGFIDYVNKNGGTMTQELVNSFSSQQAAKHGWSNYGDRNYVNNVLRYYDPDILNNVGGGNGEDTTVTIKPNNISGIRTIQNSQGGSGDESTVDTSSSLDTTRFIYNSYKNVNDNVNNALTAQKMVRENGLDGSKIDKIIELLGKISDNTEELVTETKNNGDKLDAIKLSTLPSSDDSKKQSNVTVTTQTSTDPFSQLVSNKSTDRVSDAYKTAMQIAKGRTH